mmetsp:Transcript_26214/g.46232  ORF Transcript_26214/g.46232 Transcript_26214/m.46232 type:complete len:441 (-) Transcript_26214:94-1416(-)
MHSIQSLHVIGFVLALKIVLSNSNSAPSAIQRLMEPGETSAEYGVDVSYPMQHPNLTIIGSNPLGNRQAFYEEIINDCVKHYGEKGQRCLMNEEERIAMNLRQPQSMNNYTKNGYTKIRAPTHVFKLIKEFWDKNKEKTKIEKWGTADTFVNHWSSPTYMVSIDDTSLDGGGYALKQMVWNAARDTISEWTGQQLAECSLYGIRIYKEGAVLAPHVDRLPLVSSAIINVDQDVDEPWPLEVIGHDGKATNVTMVPGDLVLYESHSVLHGRPFPLKGRFMANIFIHFEPIGPVGKEINISSDLPQYVIQGSEEEQNWRKKNPNGYKFVDNPITPGSTDAHQAAIAGNAELMLQVLVAKPQLVNARDTNGWTPLHEAARTGEVKTVEVLLDNGADVNARNKGTGGSVLWWALQYWNKEHEVVKLLESRGARSVAPGAKHSEL